MRLRLSAHALGFGLTCLLAPAPAFAVCDCAPVFSNFGAGVGSLGIGNIKLVSNSSTITTTIMNAARDFWNNGCSSSSSLDIPQFLTSGTGDAQVNIKLFANASNSTKPECQGAAGCGCLAEFVWDDGTGSPTNGEIHLFQNQTDGTPCSGSYSDSIAHELGHVLGLDNIDSTCFQTCGTRVMGPGDPTQNVYTLGTEECSRTDGFWPVPNEDNGGGGDPGGGCLTLVPATAAGRSLR